MKPEPRPATAGAAPTDNGITQAKPHSSERDSAPPPPRLSADQFWKRLGL